MAKGRGRLSSIQLLPKECSHIVMWAAAELQVMSSSQLDIYKEFVRRLEELMQDSRGEIQFSIPSYSSFNRYSVNLDDMTRYMNETREMAAAIASTFDAGESDDLTLIATEAIKSLVFQMLSTKKDKIDPKGVQALANALRAASQAQSVSTARRQTVEKEFGEKVTEAVEKVAKAKGLTAETTEEILGQILGVNK